MRTWLATAAFFSTPHGLETFCCRCAAYRRRRYRFCSTAEKRRGRSRAEAARSFAGQLSSMGHRRSQVAADRHPVLPVRAGFGMAIYMRLKNLPVHRSMREISELIYETCKTYLVTQGKFILLLWAFIAVIIAAYFGWLSPVPGKSVALTLPIILGFSLVGIAGSYGVAWFGIRVNTFANSRTAFASLPGKPYPVYQIPLEAGMSIGMMLISVELLIMLIILLFIPGDYAGPCFIGFAIGESLGAAALRIAGGIFTKIADIGVRPDEDRLQDQRRRRAQSWRDCRLHRRQCRRLGWTVG